MTSSFRAQLNKAYETKVEQKLDNVVRGTALAVFNQLVYNTPVGNPDLWLHNTGTSENPVYGHFLTYSHADGYVGGQAKASWHLDINNIDVRVMEPGYDNDSEAALRVKTHKLGDKVQIATSIPYMKRLNDGWSTQQPAGFIERSIQVGVLQGKEMAKR